MSLTRSVPPVEANYNDLDHRMHRIYRAAGAPMLRIVGLRHKKRRRQGGGTSPFVQRLLGGESILKL